MWILYIVKFLNLNMGKLNIFINSYKQGYRYKVYYQKVKINKL